MDANKTALTHRITAAQMLAKLQWKYGQPQWLSFAELRVSSGYTRDEQYIDFWTMGSTPAKCFHRLGFEIKTTRNDFSRELRQPEKRKPALLLVNRFYFVAPEGVIPVDRLPIDAGLIEACPFVQDPAITEDVRFKLTVRSEAPWLDTEPPTWGFVASLIRRLRKTD